MPENVSKMIVLPQDGSEFAIKSIDYLNIIFGPKHNLNPVLLYVTPSLPRALVETGTASRENADRLETIRKRNDALADKVLGAAKNVLLQYNFPEDLIKTVCQGCKRDIATDIADWSNDKMADGILLNCHGRSRVEAFFMGEVSLKLLDCREGCPVWLLRGDVKERDALIAIDQSENSLRAVDYAGFMFSGTESRIILFHTKRSLRRFLPDSIFEDIPGIVEQWSKKAEEEIAPAMTKAKKMLVSAGIEEYRIKTVVFEGIHHPAKDILAQAREHGCGTVILGRQGDSDNKEFAMGSIAREVVEAASDMAIWVV